MGRRVRGSRRIGAVLLTACLAGGTTGTLAEPPPASAQTIRELAWYLDAMHVEEAHRISQGAGVTVAVIDTGVDATHPDLRGRVLEGTSVGGQASAGPGRDGTRDTDGHGTGMASLIAGTGRRGANSVLGVAPQARILPVRIAQTADGSFQPSDVYHGVRWAIDHGADIVNMSLGGERSTDAPWKRRLVDYAVSRDVVLVAAAGNTGKGETRVAEPASIPGVVAVSGTTRDGRFWSGSARGPEVVVSAPAENLPMAVPTSVSASGYAMADGTSGATALVSGVAALIRSAFPDISAGDVVNRLIRTAEDRGPSGRDDRYGYGVVDARAALEGDLPESGGHPLISPGATRSDQAAVRLAGRRSADAVPIVVGGSLGTALVLLVVAYLVHLVVRARRVVVVGMAPGAPPVHPHGTPPTWPPYPPDRYPLGPYPGGGYPAARYPAERYGGYPAARYPAPAPPGGSAAPAGPPQPGAPAGHPAVQPWPGPGGDPAVRAWPAPEWYPPVPHSHGPVGTADPWARPPA